MDVLQGWLEFIGESLTLIIMVVALFGMIIPIFPGAIIIWVAALIYGIVAGFDTVAIIIFVIITILAIAASLADNIMMGKKAREEGAAWSSILLALGAAIVGTLALPPVGGLIAAPLVLYFMERKQHGDKEKALATVKALALGLGWAFVIRFAIGSVMIGLWLIWAVAI